MQLARGANGRRKMINTFAAAGCLLAVSVAVAYIIGLRALELNRDLSRESEVIRELERFVSALKDTETGQRGYLLTGDERYLAPYQDGQTNVTSVAEELQRLGASGDLPADGVRRLRDLAVKKLAELEVTIKLRRERGPQAAVEVVRSGRGRELMDEIRRDAGQEGSGIRQGQRARERSQRDARDHVHSNRTFQSGVPGMGLLPLEPGDGGAGAGKGVAGDDVSEHR